MSWSVNYRQNGTDIVKHTFDWVSDGSGNATLPSSLPVSGNIQRVVFVPDGTNTPTTGYDVTLTDADGIDVLTGQGANLTTSASSVCPGIPLRDGTTVGVVAGVVESILTLNVSNAGASKAGKVVVYVR